MTTEIAPLVQTTLTLNNSHIPEAVMKATKPGGEHTEFDFLVERSAAMLFGALGESLLERGELAFAIRTGNLKLSDGQKVEVIIRTIE